MTVAIAQAADGRGPRLQLIPWWQPTRRRTGSLALSLALHVLTIALSHPARPSGSSSAGIEVVQVTGLLGPPASPRHGSVPEDLGILMPDRKPTIDLPGFTTDFGKVIQHAASLFPFLVTRPSFDRLVHDIPAEGPRSLRNPFGTGGSSPVRAPLEVTDGDLQALLDATWSRRARWARFQPILVMARLHDPNAGRLPDLLRGYVLQNGLQPFVEGRQRDPRLWTQLAIAADHADFVDFVSEYVSAHPSTRAATELLFLLDNLAQGSLDALCTLIDTEPAADLWMTQRARPDAFDAIVAIRRHYVSVLEQRGLRMRQDLQAYFDGVRLEVLDLIVQTTPDGYRAADAQFLIGTIHWKRGRRAEAVRAWQRMVPGPADHYTRASAWLRPLLPASPSTDIDARTVERIISNEHGRWVGFSYDRLKQFGYRFDTF